jgi:hypothetical protein
MSNLENFNNIFANLAKVHIIKDPITFHMMSLKKSIKEK